MKTCLPQEKSRFMRSFLVLILYVTPFLKFIYFLIMFFLLLLLLYLNVFAVKPS